MEEMINYALQNGFAIVVAIYLLYERTRLTEDRVEVDKQTVKSLKEISVILRDVCKRGGVGQ